MKKKVYKNIDETIYEITLPNKMNVKLLYKKGFNEKTAYIVSKFGHFDSVRKIVVNGKKIKIPWGTAHFLEHRMFSINDVDAFDLFTKLGATCNAYTTYEKTAYYFSTQKNFYECLKILLNMMSSFTSSDEQIEKEKEIILQEKNMYKEEPSHILDRTIYKQAYINHPINVDIIGTSKTIKKINFDILKTVFDTFYDPSNLTLVVAGDINHKELENFLLNNLIESKNPKLIKPLKIKEPYAINKEYGEAYLPTITLPRFALLYKINIVEDKKERDINYYCYYFILDYLFSSSGKLSEKWLSSKIISTLLEYSVSSNIDLDCIIFYNISDNIKGIVDCIKEVFNVNTTLNMTQQELDDIKKNHYGFALRSYESVSGLCSNYVYDLFSSVKDFYEELDEIKSIALDDIERAYKNICNALTTFVILRSE